MLKKDIDFVPQTPKRQKVAQIGLGIRRPGGLAAESPRRVGETANKLNQRRPSPLGRLPSDKTVASEASNETLPLEWATDSERESTPSRATSRSSRVRTMEEKKEFLGQLLGNVDALVDGVKKAGVWGLGE